ncbi:MAG: energy transducer TonB [Prevotella sp.]|nr:energy transducer TonB [Prevotella sp.]
MEVKKSLAADLESRRGTRFLLGLVLALALLVVCLEYTTTDSFDDYEDILAGDIPEDMELMPPIENSPQLEALKPDLPPVTEQIVTVEEKATTVKSETEVPPRPVELALQEEVTLEDIIDDAMPEATAEVQETLPLRVVEQLPQFPGGMMLLIQWLTKNLKYPDAARRQQIQGRVMVSFIVNTDGTTVDAKVVHSVHPLLDREALRVVRMLPRWQPGVSNGKPCRTLVHLPIVFKL